MIRVAPFRVLITLLVTYLLSPLGLQVTPGPQMFDSKPKNPSSPTQDPQPSTPNPKKLNPQTSKPLNP